MDCYQLQWGSRVFWCRLTYLLLDGVKGLSSVEVSRQVTGGIIERRAWISYWKVPPTTWWGSMQLSEDDGSSWVPFKMTVDIQEVFLLAVVVHVCFSLKILMMLILLIPLAPSLTGFVAEDGGCINASKGHLQQKIIDSIKCHLISMTSVFKRLQHCWL